jgi:Zn-dependent peptidase ImmA (M78 family)/transcriptional regulator with XRE-family HTH domain
MNTMAFEPPRLRIARELAGWSQARLATEVGLTPAAVSQFESGAVRPGPDTLARVGVALKVPHGFFAQPLLDTHDGFFRSLRRTAVADRRRARAIAHVAHDLTTHAGPSGGLRHSIPQLPTDMDATVDEIERVAAHVRQVLEIPPGPVPNVVETLEDHGVVVIRMPLDTADVDAFSLPFPDQPVVVLGADKNDRARSRFDAAHELGHLVMHGDQIWGLPGIEKQAHQFAAALLMPAKQIYHQLPESVDWPALFDLKRQWQVSLAALLLRARDLGRMSKSTYLTAIKAASARGWRRTEPVPLGPPEQPSRLLAIINAKSSKAIQALLPEHVVNALVGAVAPRPT